MVNSRLDLKLARLRRIIGAMPSLLVAYSGGVDSSLLVKVAVDILGDNLLAVIARSPTYTRAEFIRAREFVRRHRIRYRVIETKELQDAKFAANPRDRCYYCKRELFYNLRDIAAERNIRHIADGANYDDRRDYRPGARAARECGVRSPLKEAGLSKRDIRLASRRMGLSTWDRPSLACLASRLPYHRPITASALRRINRAEEYLRNLGFTHVRVRDYDGLARIEVEKREIGRFLNKLRPKVVSGLSRLGYDYVTLDLEGYRSGSMNEPFLVKLTSAVEPQMST